jgi:hypothetical protein
VIVALTLSLLITILLTIVHELVIAIVFSIMIILVIFLSLTYVIGTFLIVLTTSKVLIYRLIFVSLFILLLLFFRHKLDGILVIVNSGLMLLSIHQLLMHSPIVWMVIIHSSILHVLLLLIRTSNFLI